MTNSKKFYAFLGQINTTTGNPHPLTGRLSTYGQMVAFSTKDKRDRFVSEYYNTNNPSEDAHKTNYTSAKSQYFGGISLRQYDEYMMHVDLCVDDSYDSYF